MPKKVPKKSSPYDNTYLDDVGFTIGAETANVITVACQLKKPGGVAADRRLSVKWFLADDANGDTLVATAPDGGVAAGTNGWVSQTVIGKRGAAVSEANGRLDVAVTHAAGAKTVYLGVVLPDGTLKMSGALTFA